jgi:hypothetical protein
MSYVYKRTEPQLWTVGYYDPAGKWEPESDHDTQAAAAVRVHWLNGGAPARMEPDDKPLTFIDSDGAVY